MKRKSREARNIVVVLVVVVYTAPPQEHNIYSYIVRSSVIVMIRMKILANFGWPMWQKGHTMCSETEGKGSNFWRRSSNITRDYQGTSSSS